MNKLFSQARDLAPFMTDVRRKLHSNPERSLQEIKTNLLIRDTLKSEGIPYLTVGETVTIAEIMGAKPGKTVAARADTDALPVLELADVSWKSGVPGVMHACGHDIHTAIGLGLARLLFSQREKMAGRALVIFQPAEEGGGGAAQVVKSGLLEGVSAFYALHVWPQLETGHLNISAGPVCAASSRIRMRVMGRGGHGAYPELCYSALLAAADISLELEKMVPRTPEERPDFVMSLGQLHTGSAWNIIPAEAMIEGSLRVLKAGLQEEMLGKIREIAKETAAKRHCEAVLEVEDYCGLVSNDEENSERARRSAREALGETAVGQEERALIGDDFSEYLTIAPGVYMQLGVKRPGQTEMYPLHHGLFNPDEDAMPYGLAGLAAAMLDRLKN